MKSQDMAIRTENINKLYRIGLKESMHDTFAKSIFSFIKSPLTNYRKYRSLYRFDDIKKYHDFGSNGESAGVIWALKNISFEVKRGDSLGIIGKNGSGKSTLLKVLSRITSPTTGYAEIYGRVSSLLEVGTGFHPELTGRENIYLNGTILGMRKSELDKKFDEIVDFSGVEKFIDTPVKRYSSGMRVRLAFAVAAHLEPEILIVDEVLAVGDAEFQAKCIGKMNRFAKEGRTVLFVSHNMGAVSELCNRVIWLEGGVLRLEGTSQDVITRYLSSSAQGVGYWSGQQTEGNSERLAILKHARILSNNGSQVSTIFRYDEHVKIEISYEIRVSVRSFRSYIILKDAFGNIIWGSHDTDGTKTLGHKREPGIYCSTCTLPRFTLRPGHYFVSVGIYGNPRESVQNEKLDILSFEITETGYLFNRDPRIGIITPSLRWEVERQRESEA